MSLVLVGVACVTYKQVNRHKFSDVRYDDVRSLIVERHQRSNVRESRGRQIPHKVCDIRLINVWLVRVPNDIIRF
jgi:hypothetical protein